MVHSDDDAIDDFRLMLDDSRRISSLVEYDSPKSEQSRQLKKKSIIRIYSVDHITIATMLHKVELHTDGR